MPCVVNSQSNGSKADSSANLGFEATAMCDSAIPSREPILQSVRVAKDNFSKDHDVRWQWSGATSTIEDCPQGERGGVNQFGVPPKTARRESVNSKPEGKPQVMSAAKDNNANFA